MRHVLQLPEKVKGAFYSFHELIIIIIIMIIIIIIIIIIITIIISDFNKNITINYKIKKKKG